MIITCDIHHQSLNTGNQQHSTKTELECAYDFFKICEKFNIKQTYFFSGLAMRDDWNEQMEEICNSKLVEIGGHNWNCFSPELLHRLYKKVFKSYNGPSLVERKDCEKTQEIIYQRTGRLITSWRNHMYMNGPNTEKILSSCGIKVYSDGVSKKSNGFQERPGILHLPINLLSDHEHLYHAERTEEWVKSWIKRYKWKDDFGSDSYYMKVWKRKYLESYKDCLSRGALPVSIIHPITMSLSDNYNFINNFIEYISKNQTLTIDEARLNYEKTYSDHCQNL
jgi:hypothetical protein